SSDSVARLAGDEFAVVLRDTGLADAKVIAESLLGEINQTRVSMTVGQLKLQASAGVAVTPTHGSTVQELVGAA
ncbi:MAG: diguanylate cyclase, partial [Anaerolineae bacterium]|nr:diguanylate cyclase [Anaerolineae bacterium]